MKETMKYKALKAQLKEANQNADTEVFIRLHRAISWLKCAEEQGENVDLKFITLWVSFNACYAAKELPIFEGSERTEVQRFKEFLDQLVRFDEMRRIDKMILRDCPAHIDKLMTNKYAIERFWRERYLADNNWEEQYNTELSLSKKYKREMRIAPLLRLILPRLYTVRNQLIHGGATYQSAINRKQVEDGAEILYHLVPIIIEIMIERIKEDWGSIYYPVVE